MENSAVMDLPDADADYTKLVTKNLEQRLNSLKVKFIVTNRTLYAIKSSQEFVINDVAVFQTRVVVIQTNKEINTYDNLVLVRFFKRQDIKSDMQHHYFIRLWSSKFNINKVFHSDDGTWHLIHENKKQQYAFDFTVLMFMEQSRNSFESLHDDTELTDFELRGDDGSVPFHRAVLAAASPMFRRMLCGEWKESAERHAAVPASRATLQHLKEYMYLYKLPDAGLQELVLLASYCMMTVLEQKCVDALVRDLSAQNTCDLLEFSAKNRMSRLMVTILAAVQNRDVDVKDIQEHMRAEL